MDRITLRDGPASPRASRAFEVGSRFAPSVATDRIDPRRAPRGQSQIADFAAALRVAARARGASQIGRRVPDGLGGPMAVARSLMLAARGTSQVSPSAIRAVEQTDASEYDSAEQARMWGGSTCSAASLTAVLRARGVPVRIADVMQAMPGGLTPELGLVSRRSLMDAAKQFGAVARDDVADYASLRSAVAAGQPVLVDVRNQRFPEGHWMVATGADENGVGVADSSGYHLTWVPREEFMASWSGRGIRILPAPATALRQTAKRAEAW